jgi:pentatricopeptide repeat protein
MSDHEQLEDLLGEAYHLDNGDAKVQLLEEAVKLADALQDVDMSFYSRMQFTEAATFAGRSERLMTSFSWCLAKYKEDPEQFEEYGYDLLWQFKWVIGGVSTFPHISYGEFQRLLGQMKEMYQEHGYGMRPIHYSHFRYCCDTGDFAKASELLGQWDACPPDEMEDCDACETDSLVTYHAEIDQPDIAMEKAKGILSGDQTCAEVPHITYSTLLRSLAQLNRYDEADEFHAKDYRLIRRNPEFIRQVAEHISYLTHRGNLKKAVSLLEKHVGWIIGTYELMPRYYFLTAAAHLLDRLGEGKKKLKLPTEFEKHDPSGKYDLPQLAGWFKGERDELGAAFDKRNGNDYYSRRVLELLHYDGINA